MPDHPNPLPPEGTQQWRILMGLLDGDKITPIGSIVDYNCFAVNARCSELRALGWPIRTITVPHPNQTKFPDAVLPCYLLDAHFRTWIKAEKGRHPVEYPSADGRGKFAVEGQHG